MKMRNKVVAALASAALLGGLGVAPAMAAPAPSFTHGISAPAPTWYLNKTGCRYPYYSVLQHYWWNWFQTRAVCTKGGSDEPPLFYF